MRQMRQSPGPGGNPPPRDLGSPDHLALRDQGLLDLPEHLLVADAFPAHVVAVLGQNPADLLIEAILDSEVLLDNGGHRFHGRLRAVNFD